MSQEKFNFKIANVSLHYKGHIHLLIIINPDTIQDVIKSARP